MNCLLPIALLALSATAVAQVADLAAVGGAGASGDEDENVHPALPVGATAGWPYSSRHRIQFDYVFSSISTRDYNRHFVTGSYVVQGTRGEARPYFQVGFGLTRKNWTVPWPGKTDPVLLLGGGVTVDLSRSLFLRPQVRLYASPGSNITILPAVAFGYRF